MRAALYARFSSDMQDVKSIDDQLHDLRAYAAANAWTIVETFTDAAISGESLFRPGIQALILAARAQRFDVLLTEALDRVSRNSGDTLKLRELLEFNGIRIHRPSKGDVTEVDALLEGYVNSQQMQELRRKIRRGQRGNIARGLFAGGRSYGYDVVKELGADGEIKRGVRRINETEAAIVRRIFDEYVAGVSPLEIARRLNAEGVPSAFAAKGSQWSVGSISGHRKRRQGVLQNELYLGRLIYNRVTMVKHPDTGKRISRDNAPEDWRTAELPELRIIDDATWAAAQAVRRLHGGGAHAAPPKRRQQHLLSGRVVCGACGSTYVARDKQDLTCTGFYYRGTCDNGRRVNRRRLEGRVIAEIQKLLATPEAVREAMHRLHDGEARAAAEAIRAGRVKVKELGDVRGKIARLVAAIEDGGEARALTAKIRELEERQAALEAEAGADGPGKVIALAPNAHEIYRAEIGRLTRGGLDEGDVAARAKKHGLIRALIDQVRIIPLPAGGWEWELHGRLRQFLTIAAGNKAGTGGGWSMVAEVRPGQSPSPLVQRRYSA